MTDDAFETVLVSEIRDREGAIVDQLGRHHVPIWYVLADGTREHGTRTFGTREAARIWRAALPNLNVVGIAVQRLRNPDPDGGPPFVAVIGVSAESTK